MSGWSHQRWKNIGSALFSGMFGSVRIYRHVTAASLPWLRRWRVIRPSRCRPISALHSIMASSQVSFPRSSRTSRFIRAGQITPEQLPPASDEFLPLDQAAEAQRAGHVEQDAGTVAPGVVYYTGELLFRNLWLRPGLAPRDRSLVTVSALIASGQVAQITYHLNRAMDNGLTRSQASEVLTHLAFYAGWPNVFSAIPVVKSVFEKRS